MSLRKQKNYVTSWNIQNKIYEQAAPVQIVSQKNSLKLQDVKFMFGRREGAEKMDTVERYRVEKVKVQYILGLADSVLAF